VDFYKTIKYDFIFNFKPFNIKLFIMFLFFYDFIETKIKCDKLSYFNEIKSNHNP